MRNISTALLLALTTTACANMTVSSHIERNIDFSEYVTYDWGECDNFPAGDPRLDNNPFFRDYVEGAIEKRLIAKGYERAVTGQQPDLLLHYHASVTQKVDVYEADRSHGYYPGTEPRVIEFEQGTLMVDVVDARTSRVIWRGWAQDSMTGVIDDQRRLEEQVEEGILKMMMLLPRGGATLR